MLAYIPPTQRRLGEPTQEDTGGQSGRMTRERPSNLPLPNDFAFQSPNSDTNQPDS